MSSGGCTWRRRPRPRGRPRAGGQAAGRRGECLPPRTRRPSTASHGESGSRSTAREWPGGARPRRRRRPATAATPAPRRAVLRERRRRRCRPSSAARPQTNWQSTRQSCAGRRSRRNSARRGARFRWDRRARHASVMPTQSGYARPARSRPRYQGSPCGGTAPAVSRRQSAARQPSSSRTRRASAPSRSRPSERPASAATPESAAARSRGMCH